MTIKFATCPDCNSTLGMVHSVADCTTIHDLRAKNDRLHEGLENWRKGAMTDAQRLIEAEAENERLRAGWDVAQTFMALALEREERLRAVLQEIVDHPAPSHVNNVANKTAKP